PANTYQNELLNTVMQLTSTPILDNPKHVKTLHWLDNTTDADDYDAPKGASLQRAPGGDNDNVLDSNQVHVVDVSSLGTTLATIGRLRFDTVFIRNLIFIVNL